MPVSWKNSWKVWPAVTAFSFTFIPWQYRNIFAGVIAIGWQTYLSWLNRREENRAVKVGEHTKEMEREELRQADSRKTQTVVEEKPKKKKRKKEGRGG